MCAFLSEQQQSHHRLLWLGQAGEGEVGSPSRTASPSLEVPAMAGGGSEQPDCSGEGFFFLYIPRIGVQ